MPEINSVTPLLLLVCGYRTSFERMTTSYGYSLLDKKVKQKTVSRK